MVHLLDTASNFALFLGPVWKTKVYKKKANLHENWNMQTIL